MMSVEYRCLRSLLWWYSAEFPSSSMINERVYNAASPPRLGMLSKVVTLNLRERLNDARSRRGGHRQQLVAAWVELISADLVDRRTCKFAHNQQALGDASWGNMCSHWRTAVLIKAKAFLLLLRSGRSGNFVWLTEDTALIDSESS